MTKSKPYNAPGMTDRATIAVPTEGTERVATIPDRAMAQRLRQAREAKFPTARAAASRHGWVESTYGNHESASRTISYKRAILYSTAFGVRFDWLWSNEGPMYEQERRVKVFGGLGAGGLINMPDNIALPQDQLGDVDYPPDAKGEFLAYRVTGDFNFPAFFDGDVIYTAPPAEPDGSIGKQCVVTLASGETRVGILARAAAASLYILTAFNASPLVDVAVAQAAPIVWIKRG